MENLKELNKVLKTIRLDRELPEVVGKYAKKPSGKGSKPVETLFQLLQTEDPTDDDTALQFVQSNHKNFSKNQFAVVKNRLLNRMANLITLINPNNFKWDAYKKTYFNAYKYLIIARFLANTQAKNASIYFARRCFFLSKQYQLYELYANVAGFLASLYANLGDQKSYTFFKKAHWYGLKQSQAEKEIIFAYYDWLVFFHNQSDFNEPQKSELNNTLCRLEQIHNEAKTFTTQLYLVRLQSIYYEITYNYSAVTSLWERFDQSLSQIPRFQLTIQQFESALKKMLACLNSKQYEKGTFYAEKAKNLFQPGQMNWFIWQEYYFLLLVHKRQYLQAYQILETVFNNSYYSNLPDTFKEKWILMNGYMAFAIESQWNSELSKRFPDQGQDFRVNKLLNQFPKGSRDKSGINTMILILQFLFYLNRQDYQKLINLYEPFKAYYYRYLKHTEKRKPALFVKMLNKVLQQDFDYDKVVKSTKTDYQQLTQTRIFYEGGYEDLEVLPFEEVWEWILERLQTLSAQHH